MTKTGDAARPPAQIEPETIAESFQRYQRQIVIGAIVVAAAGGGGWLYLRSAEIRETRATEALMAAEAAYGSGDAAKAAEELARVVTRYAGTAAGTQAALLAAQLKFEEGSVDEGLSLLDASLRKAPSYQRAGLHALRAAGRATAGRPADAAKDYESAAAAAQFRQEREQYEMEAARQHAMAGDKAAAERIYRRIAELEDSSHATEARLRLGEITTKG